MRLEMLDFVYSFVLSLSIIVQFTLVHSLIVVEKNKISLYKERERVFDHR